MKWLFFCFVRRLCKVFALTQRLSVQVKAGTIFDNILVCDDAEYAKAQAEKNIVPLQKKESDMKVRDFINASSIWQCVRACIRCGLL